jgi:cyclase
MILPRVIPILLLRGRGLVKTRNFKKPVYVGDPINAIRIFNDKEVDELAVVDIDATVQGRSPDLGLIAEFSTECFMPLAYGGGISRPDQIRGLFNVGVEKVVLNAHAHADTALVSDAAQIAGSSSVVVSMDVKKSLFGGYRVWTHNATRDTGRNPVAVAEQMQKAGAGELLVTSVDREGTMDGYDLKLVQSVASAVDIPVVASGGAGALQHFRQAIDHGASAVSAGSFFVFQGPHRAVLISFPSPAELRALFGGATTVAAAGRT